MRPIAMGWILEPILESSIRLLRWWLCELHDMMPPAIRQRLVPDRPGLILEFDGDAVRLGRNIRGSYQSCGQIAEEEIDQALPPALVAALAGFRPHQVELRLPATRILHQKVLLPLGPSRRLPDLLRFELDRQTPFAPSQVYYDARIVERDPAGKTMIAALALVKRRDADRLLAIARRWRLAPTRLTVLGDPRWSLDFRTEDVAERPSLRRHRIAVAMAATTLTFALAAWRLHAAALDAYGEALDAELSRSRPAAESVNALQKELADREASIAFLDHRRKSTDIGRLLEALAGKLPDDTWISSFGLSGRSIRISGFSAEAAQLPTVLSDLPLLSKLQLSKGQEQSGPGSAAFELSAELRDGAEP